HARREPEVDALLRVEPGGTQGDPFLRRFAREVVLRQVGTIAWRIRLLAQHREPPPIPFPAQLFRGGKARRAATDDDDALRWIRDGAPRGDRLVQALAHDATLAVALDMPAGNGIEGGRAQRLARAQGEARMVERAPDGFPVDDPLVQGPL